MRQRLLAERERRSLRVAYLMRVGVGATGVVAVWYAARRTVREVVELEERERRLREDQIRQVLEARFGFRLAVRRTTWSSR